MHGLVNWFARNPVAANLLMVFIIAAGAVTLASRLPLEVFPSFELERISVRVPYRGATPVEVEQGITIKIEEAVQDLQGIKELRSSAVEGLGTVTVYMDSNADGEKLLDEVRQRVDQIGDLPQTAERPSVYVPSRSREVISVIVAGALPETELIDIASRVRDDIEALPSVSSVQVSGARDFELAIEVSEQTLAQYQLTLADVSSAITNSSLEMSAGAIRTSSGEVLLRTTGQANSAEDYREVVVRTRPDGTRITLGDIATVTDGFDETSLNQTFNGQASVEVDVFRTGLQSAITVAEEVKGYLAEAQEGMPYGVTLGYWRDSSRVVNARLNTLLESALFGGALILLLLTLFLRFWVAVWVFVGVPVSILGGIAIMPFLGVSVNLLSLFAFILVLGIVVDDAIVTGENIYTHMRRNPNRVQAVIDGTNEVAIPVTFGVLTTVAAFIPLLMIEGVRGQIFAQIPMIVIPVLLFSIVESKFVLPSHMSHLNFHSKKRPNVLARVQHKIADGFEWFVLHVYRPCLAFCLEFRYAILAGFIGVAMVVFSLVSAGHVRFIFFPRVQSEIARVMLEMPEGTPFETTQRHVETMTGVVRELQAEYVDAETNRSVIENILSTAGSAGGGSRGSHRGRVMFEIMPPEQRTIDVSSSQLVREMRKRIGSIPGAKNLTFRAEIGRGGSPIDVQISGFDFDQLREAAGLIKSKLHTFDGVTDVSDSFEGGKQEIQLSLKPSGQQLGLTLSSVASQVRSAFLGTEVQSFQRGRNDVQVVVKYPSNERVSITNVERMLLRTPAGESVPLSTVADVFLGRGFSAIKRVDRRRTVNVEADVNKELANVEGIKQSLSEYTQELEPLFPNLRFSLEGEAREQRESFGSLKFGILFVLLVIYTLLAIPFRSYTQPIMVMLVIPFGVVGGILGHLIMGMSLSIMSYLGMLALCGVVVNDSLVARFRAVILTSLTTFFGLVPLIFETSTQAQFLIPMAVSLGFGILFATVVTLLFIPVMYLVFADLGLLLRKADQWAGEGIGQSAAREE